MARPWRLLYATVKRRSFYEMLVCWLAFGVGVDFYMVFTFAFTSLPGCICRLLMF